MGPNPMAGVLSRGGGSGEMQPEETRQEVGRGVGWVRGDRQGLARCVHKPGNAKDHRRHQEPGGGLEGSSLKPSAGAGLPTLGENTLLSLWSFLTAAQERSTLSFFRCRVGKTSLQRLPGD